MITSGRAPHGARRSGCRVSAGQERLHTPLGTSGATPAGYHPLCSSSVTPAAAAAATAAASAAAAAAAAASASASAAATDPAAPPASLPACEAWRARELHARASALLSRLPHNAALAVCHLGELPWQVRARRRGGG